MNSKRGLSTVIGAVFFIVAFTTTMGYVAYSMNLLDRFGDNIISKNQEEMERSNEEFKISKVTIDNNKFNITVQNTGSLPIQLTRLWVENTTDTDKVFKYDLSKQVFPSKSTSKIGQDLPLYAKTTQAYDMKVITQRGNVKEFSVNTASAQPLYLQLFTLPDKVPTGFTTTILFSVTNNMSNNGVLTNLQPDLRIDSIDGGVTNLVSGPEPAMYQSLEKGETAYFQWTYTMVGDEDQGAKFTVSLQNGYPGNSISKDVLVDIIEISEESKTALVSKGLSIDSTPIDVLILHKEWESADLPSGAHQLYSVQPDNTSGQIFQLDTYTNPANPLFFITNNDTEQIEIPSGKWNATLRYISNPMPDSLDDNEPGIDQQGAIWHFEDGSCSSSCTAKDSTGDANNALTLGTSISQPAWEPTIGPNGSGTFYFDGGDYMDDTVNSDYDLQGGSNGAATTSGWFKTAGSGTQIIFRIGEDISGSKDHWQIGLVNQNFRFEYRWSSGSSDISVCQTTTGIWNDDHWHHFIAKRTGWQTCELYLDGQTNPAWNDSNNGGSASIDVSGEKISIGRNSTATSGQQHYFTGYLDDIIHWDNYDLKTSSPNEVADLFKTSYGNNAHRVTFTIDKTDDVGTTVQNLITSNSYPLKFIDGFGTYGSPQATSWDKYDNFTATISNVSIPSDSNQRIKFAITFVGTEGSTPGKLDMKLHADESDIALTKLYDTFLQMPTPDKSFPAFYKYSKSLGGSVNVFNPGPRGAWLTYQSRVVFETMDESLAYGAWFTSFDSHPLTTQYDSDFFTVGESKLIPFDVPDIQPNGDTSGQGEVVSIPSSSTGIRYKMYVFLSGYDQKGGIFIGTQYIGVVRVVN